MHHTSGSRPYAETPADSADHHIPVRPELRVLCSLRPPDGTIKYVDQMIGGNPSEIVLVFFSWWSALFGRYDLFHLHWPERLLLGPTRMSSRMRLILVRILLVRLRWSGIPIVRTLHNVEPHESATPRQKKLFADIDRQTAGFIKLNPTTEVDPNWATTEIPLGHYRDALAAIPKPPTEPGRLTFVGLIRPYKNVDALIEAFAGVEGDRYALRIAGKPTPALSEHISALASRDPRVSTRLEFIPDEDLVDEVSRAEVVVLPYAEMHNSGIVLVALSLARPVLVPATPSNQALSDEVGPGWVIQYHGDLTSATLEDAVRQARASRTAAEPRLIGRDWSTIGERTYQFYLGTVRGRSNPEGSA